jgi:hypothetical protein
MEGIDAATMQAIALLVIALVLPPVLCLWLRDTWRRLHGPE